MIKEYFRILINSIFWFNKPKVDWQQKYEMEFKKRIRQHVEMNKSINYWYDKYNKLLDKKQKNNNVTWILALLILWVISILIVI